MYRAGLLFLHTFLLVLILFTSVTFAAETVADQKFTVCAPYRYKITTPGYGLYRLAEDVGHSPEEILAMNPNIAARTNPEQKWWLRLFEGVAVPLCNMFSKTAAEISDTDTILVSMGELRAKENEIRSKNAENITLKAILDETNQKRVDLTLESSKLNKELRETRVERDNFRSQGNTWFYVGIILLLVVMALVVYLRDAQKNLEKTKVKLRETESGKYKLEIELNAKHKMLQDLLKRFSPRTTVVTPPKPEVKKAA